MSRLATFGMALAAVSTIAMTLIGALDVLATALLNRPLPAALELSETLMVVVVFLALAYTQQRRQHIAVQLLYDRMPRGAQRAVTMFARLLGLLFFSVLAWQAWQLFWHSWTIREYASGIIRFPVYPSKAFFALGVLLMAAQHLRDLLVAADDRAPDDAVAPEL